MLAKTMVFLLSGSIAVLAFANDNDITKMNGSILLEPGQTSGNLSTITGSVRLGSNAQAGTLKTVTGVIELGNDSKAYAAEVVMGDVLLGERVKISKDIATVDGNIILKKNVDVGGSVSNVKGDIKLYAAHVRGGIKTVRGDVTINEGSRVDAGIFVDKETTITILEDGTIVTEPSAQAYKPRIIIGPHVVIAGKLEFYREVDLYVSSSAQVGEIMGATAQMFSGASPTI